MLATWGTSTGFNPASLFAGGVQGAWYDPSDNTTMFATVGAIAPVSAVETAVGLILDKSKGLTLGSERITNGDFATDTVWGKDAGWTIGSGVATFTSPAAGNRNIFQSVSLTTGRFYQVTFEITSLTAGSFQAYAGGVISDAFTTTGVKTCILGPASDNLFLIKASSNCLGSVDNVSLREIAGNHAYQTTSASRPTLRARYNLLTFSEQFDNAAWTAISTSVTQNDIIAPDGTLTADRVTATTGGVGARLQQDRVVPSSGTHTYFLRLKRGNVDVVATRIFNNTTSTNLAEVNFNLATGVVSSTVVGSGTITNIGNDWYLCAVTSAGAVSAGNSLRAYVYPGGTSPALNQFVYAWGADLRSANDTYLPYQRIAAATDYDTGAAFPQYLSFDGTDDSLLTANVDFATVTSDGQARRNLLLNPTQFDDAAWGKTNCSISQNAIIAPDGTQTADKLVENTATGTHNISQTFTFLNQNYVCSVYVSKTSERNAMVYMYTAVGFAGAVVNVANGTASVFSGSIAGTTATAVDVGAYWRVSVTALMPASAGNAAVYAMSGSNASYTGDGTSGIFIWGAQLETGSTATAFQNIGTDKMTVWSGVSKLSDAARGTVVELSADIGTNAGSFALRAPQSAAGAGDYGFFARGSGTLAGGATAASYAAPITSVLTGLDNISTDALALRINGTQVLSDTSTDQGTGNFGNYPLYVGRRNNATIPFNGRIYSLIVRGAESNSTQIAQTERYVASKTPLGVVP